MVGFDQVESFKCANKSFEVFIVVKIGLSLTGGFFFLPIAIMNDFSFSIANVFQKFNNFLRK